MDLPGLGEQRKPRKRILGCRPTEVKVDETAPNAPLASAARAPDYAGGGGWYKDSVEVSFT